MLDTTNALQAVVNPTHRRRVLIAGGGIVGLTTALALHQSGHEVTVFESVAEPRELGVGINLLPHSVRILHELGLKDRLDDIAIQTKRLSFYSDDGVKIWEEARGLDAGNPWPQYSLHRGRFQMLLFDVARQRLGEGRVVTGHHFGDFSQDSNGVRATFVNKATGQPVGSYEGDILLGADGLHSTLRASFYPDQGPPFYSGLMLWRGCIEGEPFLDGQSMFMAGHDNAKAVVYPIGEPERRRGRSLINWIAELPVDVDMDNPDWNRESSAEAFVDQFADWSWDWIDLPSLFRQTPVCYEFPMVDRTPVDRWSFGRVSLIGDAAHAMRPNGSNGSSQGIIDAEAMVAALAVTSDDVDALAAYEEARLETTARIVLANRESGPERVLQWVKDRCNGDCRGQHRCVPPSDLERAANDYKKLAGFDIAELQRRAAARQQ